MNYNVLGAVLLGVLALALPALIIRYQNPGALRWMRPKGLFWWDLITSELGVAVVTYLSDFTGTGTTTAPTAAQASQLPCQVFQVFLADTDTQAILTTNWGILLGPSFASFGWPIVPYPTKVDQTVVNVSFATNFTFGLSLSNSIYMNKPVGTGTGGTFYVYAFLPSSFMARSR